jgi:hypothetical protein
MIFDEDLDLDLIYFENLKQIQFYNEVIELTQKSINISYKAIQTYNKVIKLYENNPVKIDEYKNKILKSENKIYTENENENLKNYQIILEDIEDEILDFKFLNFL